MVGMGITRLVEMKWVLEAVEVLMPLERQLHLAWVVMVAMEQHHLFLEHL
jgi:hypothetical protein